MYYSNCAYETQEFHWNLPEWNYFVSEIEKVFRLTPSEKEKLNNSITAKLIATIPFEAKCKNPERTAIAHLCLYESEILGFQKYCSHLPSDDSTLFERLSFISNFEGGDEKIINHGMNILALLMLEGYKKSISKDQKINNYNPLVSKAWNYQTLKNKLIWEIQKDCIPNLDWVFQQDIYNIIW